MTLSLPKEKITPPAESLKKVFNKMLNNPINDNISELFKEILSYKDWHSAELKNENKETAVRYNELYEEMALPLWLPLDQQLYLYGKFSEIKIIIPGSQVRYGDQIVDLIKYALSPVCGEKILVFVKLIMGASLDSYKTEFRFEVDSEKFKRNSIEAFKGTFNNMKLYLIDGTPICTTTVAGLNTQYTRLIKGIGPVNGEINILV